MKIFIAVGLCLSSLLFGQNARVVQVHTVERRAALDIGSGSIKLQVSDVDLSTNKIARTLLTDSLKIALREDLDNSSDGKLSDAIQNTLVDAIRQLRKRASVFNPKAYYGIATEALRMAKNGNLVVQRIKTETGIPVSIVTQEQEGVLGFISAASATNEPLEKVVTWDFGAGSTQMTTLLGECHIVYLGRFGKVSMKQTLLKIQKKAPENVATSPNPISLLEAQKAIQHVEDSLGHIPPVIRQKVNWPNVLVLGIGINPLYGMQNSASFSRDRLWEEIQSRLNMDDEQISQKDSIPKEYAIYRVSNLILAYGIVKALGIHQVRYVGTDSSNAVGVLLSPKYW